MFSKDEYNEVMERMIHKNEKIPCERLKTATLTKNDKSLIILEGKSLNSSECTKLGEIPLHGLGEGDKIDVMMEINQDNILTVKYTDTRRGKTNQTTFLDKQNLEKDLVTELVN